MFLLDLLRRRRLVLDRMGVVMNTIHKFEHGNYGIALRHNPAACHPWVTHQFNSMAAVNSGRFTPGFYWGHYFEEAGAAVSDFISRCKDLGVSLSKPERSRVHQTVFDYSAER